MKKLLLQFDTDAYPSSFDAVVAYDGGADQVLSYGGLRAESQPLAALVQGAIFTRAPKDKKNTAIFVGGGNLLDGQTLFEAIQKQFFAGFRVSVMFDSNGCNTTAAAMVAKLSNNQILAGMKAVILAGTGPVGQRAAVLLAKEGVEVYVTTRSLTDAKSLCDRINNQFEVNITPVEAIDQDARAHVISKTNANIVLATGAAGVELLSEEHWRDNPTIELIADANTTPPLGIGGTDMMDKGVERHGKIIWGALGFGPLKLALHRACISKLFEDNKQVFDAETIYGLAKEMA